MVLKSILSFLIATIKTFWLTYMIQTAARAFRRVESPPPVAQIGTDGIQNASPPCVACQQRHIPGYCPLRHAGVEFCGLCGLAHLGGRRACPHLQSSVQVTRMLEALEKSTEAPSLVYGAKKYLQGILRSVGRTTRDERKKALLSAQQKPQIPLTSSSVGEDRTNAIDLTEASGES